MFINNIVTEFLVRTYLTPLSESPILNGIKTAARFMVQWLEIRRPEGEIEIELVGGQW